MRSNMELMALAKMHQRDRIKASEERFKARCAREAAQAHRGNTWAHVARPQPVAPVAKNNVLF